MKRTLVFVLMLSSLLIFSLFIFCSESEKAEYLKVTSLELDQTLEKIKIYDYGQSREHLTQLGDYVRYVDKSSDVFQEFENKFIRFLESDATLAGKLFICKQLSIIGTDVSIPTLAKLLLEERTSDMARYALERISGEKVAEKVGEGLFNSLKERFSQEKDVTGKKLLKDFKNDPEIFDDALTKFLQRRSKDKDFQNWLIEQVTTAKSKLASAGISSTSITVSQTVNVEGNAKTGDIIGSIGGDYQKGKP